ncbi:MAG: N-6 DNA methylase [Pyrinomonadaceae bacterium]
MLNLHDISQWQKALGLLPIKLFSNSENNFILLDGGIGDFCLDISHEEKSENYYFSSAWSSNTKNFVAVNGEVTIYNWRKDKKEKIKISSVAGNYNKFYEYLISSSINSEIDIIPFVLSIFRKLRNLTDDKKSGAEALNLLFLLLASYEEKTSFDNINKTKWGLSNFNFPEAEFQKYVEEFSKGISSKLKPEVELILRHSSGALFQEAQKEALFFDKTPDMFSGTFSGSYSTKTLSNSSIHYTPSYLARTIVENALNSLNLNDITNLKILDPACGSAEFLMEALKQLKSRNFEGNVHVTGRDISPSAINTSNFLLSYEKREWEDKLSLDVRLVEDSLRETWDKDYDLILMNPPFSSWVEMGKEAREAVVDSLEKISEKRPNQASAFVYKSINSLKEGGVIGSVIPSSLLTLDSYKKLRSEIQEIISFSLIGKLGNFVFQDAFTDISIIVGQKPKNNENPLILWTRNEKEIAIDALRNLRKLQSANLPSISEKNTAFIVQQFFHSAKIVGN